MKTPQEILLDNELVITMMNVHHYVPSKDHGNFRQVVAALQQINPKAVYRTDCSGCMLEIGRMAQIHLDAYKATLKIPTYEITGGEITSISLVDLSKETASGPGITAGVPFHTFPKHEKKNKGRKPGSKNKPK